MAWSMSRRGGTRAGVALLAVISCAAMAHDGGHDDAPSPRLGTVDFRIDCNAGAQAAFNRGVALLHHMTYPQARLAFREAVDADDACAMAHWGIAMTLFTPLWPSRPDAKAREEGWREVLLARQHPPADARQRGFIAAAAAFFQDPADDDYWARVRRWEAAQHDPFDAFPDDPDVATFYALSHLAGAPPTGDDARVRADHAAGILQRVHEAHPDHPGAMHYLVHANDVPGRERESLDVTRQYDAQAPDNPHALHMPTHIYTRLGDWPGVIAGNLRAADAALAHPAGEQGEFTWDEFPHAIEYLVYAYLQQGDDANAERQLARLRATPHIEPTAKTAFHFASTPSRLALERHDWAAAAAITPRAPASISWDRFPWQESIACFARGIGAARGGDVAEARRQRARLATLEKSTRANGEELFAQHVHVTALALDGWIAHADGDRTAAVASLQAAATLEASIPKPPVTPGPSLPAAEQLGDLLMLHERPVNARAAYERAIAAYPNRFHALLGAARAARAAGDAAAARRYYATLLAIAAAGSRREAMAEARAFVDAARPGS